MKRRATTFARAVGAFLATAALVVGVPLLLISLVGNPLPSSIPSIDELRILLTQNGQGFSNFVIGALAILIWLMWAQLIAALLVEVVATVRQTETRRLPTAPGIQALAARLVATILLATTLAASPLIAPALQLGSVGPLPDFGRTEAASTLGSAPEAAARSNASTMTHATDDRHRAMVLTKSAPEQSTMSSFVVRDHTELWDLAEAAYGDGVSWKLIAQANTGSVDGAGLLIAADSASVAPDTELMLPGKVDAEALAGLGTLAGGEASAPATAALAIDEHIVEPGDSMWLVAEAEVQRRLDRQPTTSEVAEYWSTVVQANADVSSGDVDLIFPGETLALPNVEGAVVEQLPPDGTPALERAELPPVLTEPPADPVDAPVLDERAQSVPIPATGLAQHAPGVQAQDAPVAERAPVAEPSQPSDVDRSVEPAANSADRSLVASGLVGLGGALLAAGVLGAVRRRRSIQRRTRPQGAMARAHSSETAAFEAALIHSAHRVVESQQDGGWRMLPVDAVTSMRSIGPLEIHAEATGRLQAVVVDAELSAADPQRIDLESTLERADVEALFQRAIPTETVDLPDPGTAVVPTALLVGTDTTTGEAVLIDLASAGTVELVGDASQVRRFVRSAILDLAVSDRADDLCVISVGVAQELDDLERVHCVESFAEALAYARRCGHASSGSTTPVLVVAADRAADDDSIGLLRELGVYVLAPGVEAEAQVVIEQSHAIVMPAGTAIELVALCDTDYRSTCELIDSTSAQAFELVDETFPISQILDIAPTVNCPVEAGPIDVKVLGPVEVTGAEPFSSLKAVDVITYLAFHRHGVDADQIKTWVWPAYAPPTDKAFANVMSRARTGLGADESGAPYLSRAGADKTYRLSAQVTTDFDRFRALVDAANEAADVCETITLLRRALELVRGVPFAGGSASSFAWADNHVRAQVEYSIDEAVHRCADLAIADGDLSSARWAALKGLELVPGCEQCYRRRFLVARASNNRTELRRAMADLERTAASELGEPEAVDTISDDLLELYQELDQALAAGAK